MKPFEIRVGGFYDGDGEFGLDVLTVGYATSGSNSYILSGAADIEYGVKGEVAKKKADVLSAGAKALAGISVTTPPTKIAYTAGETFDKTGAVVEAYYTDGTKKTVTTSAAWTPTVALAATDTHADCTYTEDGVSKTVSVGIVVAAE